MKKLLFPLLILLACSLPGCATTKVDATGATVQTTKIEQAQDVATKSVLSLGEVLISTPKFLKTARAAGKLDKNSYNYAVDIYNQALASYVLLDKALQAAIAAGEDPSKASGYVAALATFMGDKNMLDNIIVATGGK